MQLHRASAIREAEQQLRQRGAPRLQMTLVLICTAGVGFLTSALLLQVGLTRMALRYPLAVLVAYIAFLLLLRLWLALQRPGRSRSLDLDPGGIDLVPRGATGGGGGVSFGGGSGGGGGAGGTWANAAAPPARPLAAVSRGGGARAGGKASGWDLDLDDGAVLVLPAIAALAAALASFYVIYTAPALLAELLVDGMVVSALYSRIRGVERRHWLRGVLRRTWLPALLTAGVFAVAGHLMQRAVPEAASIGRVWEHVVGGR